MVLGLFKQYEYGIDEEVLVLGTHTERGSTPLYDKLNPKDKHNCDLYGIPHKNSVGVVVERTKHKFVGQDTKPYYLVRCGSTCYAIGEEGLSRMKLTYGVGDEVTIWNKDAVLKLQDRLYKALDPEGKYFYDRDGDAPYMATGPIVAALVDKEHWQGVQYVYGVLIGGETGIMYIVRQDGLSKK